MKNQQRKIGWCLVFIATLLWVSLSSAAKVVSWKSTTVQNPWVDKGNVPVTAWDNDQTLYIEVDEAQKYQVIDGWGGAINEYGWVAMACLSQTERDKVMKALFDTSGCAISMGRICIGANDYSLSFYSCSESPDDYTMTNFSLAKDKVNVIPFALAAKAINPNIKFWGAPHSPPAWMKQNNNMIDGSLKTDEATLKAYALYFQKWVEGMDAEGIPIYAVHVQNEPNITGNGYPACLMSGVEMGNLIKNYIGPQFRDNSIETEIWVGTLHSANPDYVSFYPEYIPPTLGDPTINAFITGVGMQWNALKYAHQVPENYPSKKTMQTEAQCGNFFWMPDYADDVAPNDWAYGVFTVKRIMEWLRAGVNSYAQWNMVLDETGISNSTVRPWPQNSMISINQTTKVVRYNPQFYAVKHFSHFVKAGAERITATGNYSTGGSNLLSANLGESVTDGDMMAFLNPNGDKVLVLRNSTGSDKAVAVKVDTSKFKPTIPANSFNTFFIKESSAIQNSSQGITVAKISTLFLNNGSVMFTIPALASVSSHSFSLVIMDVRGRVVKTAQEELLQPGQVSVVWNGKNDSGLKAVPGVYIAHIHFGNNSVVQKFAITRE